MRGWGRRRPELPPSSATVSTAVKVAGVLLQAVQQQREAGAAADADDLRARGQPALLVEQVDHALGSVGARPAASTLPNWRRANTTPATPRPPKSRARSQRGQNCRVSVPTMAGKVTVW